MKREITKGSVFVLLGGVLWGFSGNCGQYLIQQKGMVSQSLVPFRLLIGGVLLLLICFLKNKNKIFDVWKEKKDRIDVIIFAACGMAMCQYTYFAAIAASNAGTATVLQYLGPSVILIYVSIRHRKMPKSYEVLSVALAIIGTFLLATHGNPATMVLSQEALFWGLASAITFAIYTVYPGRLMNKYGTALIAGWGMLLGGIMLTLVFRSWQIPVLVDAEVVLGMAAIILLGTVLAFTFYLEGVRIIGPKIASIYASVEPVAATIIAVLWMNVKFEIVDMIGFACIIATIFILSIKNAAQQE